MDIKVWKKILLSVEFSTNLSSLSIFLKTLTVDHILTKLNTI